MLVAHLWFFNNIQFNIFVNIENFFFQEIIEDLKKKLNAMTLLSRSSPGIESGLFSYYY